ncbi:hypothetical protein QAD02_020530 [Eretmocerus hayati]|uniref:Uncharacterized protein n=1 Tax=Eretmocerus hayati TaxID=131215 RepID=A0ACC2PMV6_9HYME|nr:hypothetical protein QAD02_020530 [Eretmocerus hayati]
MLEHKSDPYSSAIVDAYLEGLVGSSKVNKVLRVGSITYLGAQHPMSGKLVEKFGIQFSALSFHRCIINGCLFMTDKRDNLRTCNYYAQLEDQSFIRISEFIVDLQGNSEQTFCRPLVVRSNQYSSVVKEIIGYSDGKLVPTNHITSICVQVDVEDKKYITPLPNLLHY